MGVNGRQRGTLMSDPGSVHRAGGDGVEQRNRACAVVLQIVAAPGAAPSRSARNAITRLGFGRGISLTVGCDRPIN